MNQRSQQRELHKGGILRVLPFHTHTPALRLGHSPQSQEVKETRRSCVDGEAADHGRKCGWETKYPGCCPGTGTLVTAAGKQSIPVLSRGWGTCHRSRCLLAPLGQFSPARPVKGYRETRCFPTFIPKHAGAPRGAPDGPGASGLRASGLSKGGSVRAPRSASLMSRLFLPF